MFFQIKELLVSFLESWKNMQKKIKVAIIGTGNIGSDLLMKIKRSPWLECNLFAGRSLTSKGIQRAKEMGIPVSAKSIHAIARGLNADGISSPSERRIETGARKKKRYA